MSAFDIKKILLKDLKTWCQQNNIKSSGTKNVLITRIQSHKETLDKCTKEFCIEKTATANTRKMFQQNVDDTGKDLPTRERSGNDNDNANFNEHFQPQMDNDDGATGWEENQKSNDGDCSANRGREKHHLIDYVNSGENNDAQQCEENDVSNNNVETYENFNEDENVVLNKGECSREKMDSEIDRQRKELQNLTQQIEVLKKKKQLLELQNELARFEINPTTTNQAMDLMVPFETLKELLPVFDDDSQFDIWFLQLKSLRENFKINENILRALICSKVKGRAQEWLHSHPMYLTESVDEFLKNMGSMFSTKESKMSIRNKLQNRVWQGGESFDKYYNEKLVLSNSLKMEEDEFMEYIIEGIPDINLRNTAKLQCFASKKKILQAFRNVELYSTPTVHQQSNTPTRDGQRKETYNNNKMQMLAQDAKRDVKCYNCNSKGHMAGECRKPKRQDGACFACGDVGHQAKDCVLYKKTNFNKEHNDYNAS